MGLFLVFFAINFVYVHLTYFKLPVMFKTFIVLQEFSDFLMPMLEFDPKERVTAEEALHLPFLKDI